MIIGLRDMVFRSGQFAVPRCNQHFSVLALYKLQFLLLGTMAQEINFSIEYYLGGYYWRILLAKMSYTEILSVQPTTTATYIPNDGLRGSYNAPQATDQVIRSCNVRDSELDNEVVDRPSIRFQPSRQDFDARVARQAEKRINESMPALPEGFPEKIASERAWTRGDIDGVHDFVVHLSEEEVGEVKDALKHFLREYFEEIVQGIFRY